MPKVTLTPKFIKNDLICPADKRRIEFCDSLVPGHYVEVRSTAPGTGTHYLRYRDDLQKTCHQKLAAVGEISLREARDEAKRLKAEIRLGSNPRAEAKAKKAVMTWNQYMETIYIPHVMAHLRSWKNLVSLNEMYLKPKIGHLPLDRITLHTAQTLHRDMVEVHGLSPASADHLGKMLRQSMNYAERLSLITKSPISKIRLFNVDNREERLMSDEELQRLMAVLDSDKNRIVCLAIRFLLLTACRVSEALHAQWSDIDLETRSWIIQASNSKSKRKRSVPLNDDAIAILKQLNASRTSDWIFTSSRGKGDQRLTTIDKTWQRIRKEADLEHIRIHDLRHMGASMILNSGHSLYIAQQILDTVTPQ
jgi:integrase